MAKKKSDKELTELTVIEYHRFQGGEPFDEEDHLKNDWEAQWNPLDEAILAKIGGLGLPLKQLAAMLGTNGISVQRMEQLYSRVLNRTRAKLNADIASTIYEKAMAGDSAMLALWAKTQMGWTETTKRTLSMDDKTEGAKTPTMISRRLVSAEGKEQVKEAIIEEALGAEEAEKYKKDRKQERESFLGRLRNSDT